MNQEFSPKIPKSLLVLSGISIALMIFLAVFIPIYYQASLQKTVQSSFIFGFLLIYSLWILLRLLKMGYVIQQGEIVARGLYKTHHIRISEIEEIKRAD